MLLGSDYPFPLGEEHAGRTVRASGFDADVEARLLGTNAVEFLGSTERGMTDVGIAGAGLVGPLLAVYLARRGHDVTLYERRARPSPRPAPRAGRSTSPSRRGGIDALERVGARRGRCSRHGLAMRGRTVHSRTGELAFQSYSADGSKAINSISATA